jgi:hypothetical protein
MWFKVGCFANDDDDDDEEEEEEENNNIGLLLSVVFIGL